ncbi:MAG: ABC transporter permease [Bacteroidota bacterium]
MLLVLAFQGIWYTKGTYDFYVNDALFINAAAIFYRNLAGGGMLVMIIVAMITGGVLYKDIQHKTALWFFAMPIREKEFFIGRFLSAYVINVLLVFGYVVGMLLTPYVGIGEPDRFGPAPLAQLLQGYIILLIPNLLLLTSAVFAFIVRFTKASAGYFGVFFIVMLFFVTESSNEPNPSFPILQLLDPFGFKATEFLVERMDVAAKNASFLPFSGYLLFNRLVWLMVSFLLILWSYKRSTFKGFLRKDGKESKLDSHQEKSINIDTVYSQDEFLKVHTSFSIGDQFQKMLTLIRLEFLNVVRPISFRVVLGIVLLMVILLNLFLGADFLIGNTVPLTFTMTAFRLEVGVFIIILLMIWSSDLFFKERTANLWPIADALPVPTWTTLLSKFLAMVGVAGILSFFFMCIGVLAQILKGGAAYIDWSLYIYDIFGFQWGWLTYVLEIALVFFIAGLTGNRFMTHFISSGLFLMLILAHELGLVEQALFGYAVVPGLEGYSEMSGYGVWKLSAPWFYFMWLLAALLIICLGIFFWRRGSEFSFFQKFRRHNSQLGWPGKIVAVSALVSFIAVRAKVVNEVQVLGKYQTSYMIEANAADYEKTYSAIQETEQPKYRQVDLTIDFFPDEQMARYEASLVLISVDHQEVSSLYLNLPAFVTIESFTMSDAQELKQSQYDQRHGLAQYQIPAEMANDTLRLELVATKQYLGFSQDEKDSRTDLSIKNVFGSIYDFLPVIGYDKSGELTANLKRKEYDLESRSSRMPSIDDKTALNNLAISPDAFWVNGTVRLSTVEGQQPLGPGQIVKSWSQDGRNYASFVIENPTPFNWCFGSFETKPKSMQIDSLQLSMWAFPKHPFNLVMYENAVEKSFTFIEKELGAFPFKELRLVEIPHYQEPFYAFPNTIAISEKEGWYADTTGLEERVYIYHTVASQMIQLWLQANVKVAAVQGADMLQKALPEAIALQVVSTTLGSEAVDLIIEKKKELYYKNRNNEPNAEPTLIYSDGAEYLESNKGVIALNNLINAVGVEVFVLTLKEWMSIQGDGNAIFKSLYDQLYFKLKPEERKHISEVFEEVI